LKDVTLAGDTAFGSPNGGRWDIRVRANTGPGPGLRGNGFNLTKVGPGFLSIACQRNLAEATPYWELNLGDVFIEAGTLAFAESLTFGNPAKRIAVNTDAILQLFDLGLTNPVLRSVTLTNAQLTSGGNATDTNVINGTIALTGDNRIRLDQAVLILNGPLAGSGSLNISANEPGRIYLNGNSTFAGDTTVTNGTLGGTGVLAGNLIMLGGTNAPGFGIGTLTVNGSVMLGGTALMEIDRAQAPNSDRLVVGGSLTFGGNLVVTLPAGAATPQAGDVYQLFSGGGSGGFTAVTLPDLSALPGGLSWNTDDLLTQGRISIAGGVPAPTMEPPQVSGGNLILAGSGGPANGSFAILSSTNVATPLTEWITNTIVNFSDSGAFSNAIPLTPGEPNRFYLLKQP
jgi:autotransporter-associated beta strand protein